MSSSTGHRGSHWIVKNDCYIYPTHQTRQQWTAKYVKKNRVSLKITTQNNKNVIFIGFDGQFDLKPTSKIQKKTRKFTRFVFANNCTECKFWVVTFKPTVSEWVRCDFLFFELCKTLKSIQRRQRCNFIFTILIVA